MITMNEGSRLEAASSAGLEPGAAAAARYIKHPRSAAAVTRYASTRWPHIGGPDLKLLEADAFEGQPFTSRYRLLNSLLTSFPGAAPCRGRLHIQVSAACDIFPL